MYPVENCVTNVQDVTTGQCLFEPKLIRAHLVSTKPNFKIPFSELTKADILTMLKNRDLYYIKGFRDAPEQDITGVTTAKTGYGATVITSFENDIDITYDYPYSQCGFSLLQSWNGVKMYSFPVDESGRIGGILVKETNGTFSLRGISSQYGVPSSLPFKFTKEEIVVKPIKWIADAVKLDHYAQLDFQYDEIDGIFNTTATVTNVTSAGFSVSFETFCDSVKVSGLTSDIVVTDSNGDPVVVTIAETNGTYAVSGAALVAGTYSVNLDESVVQIGDQLYGAPTTGTAVVIPA